MAAIPHLDMCGAHFDHPYEDYLIAFVGVQTLVRIGTEPCSIVRDMNVLFFLHVWLENAYHASKVEILKGL